MSHISATILGYFLSALLLYKYVALFLVGYIAALILPIPASTTLTAAGGFSAQGFMNIYGVFATALAANVCGDLTGYFLARRFGEQILRKIGFGRLLRSKAYHKFSEYIVDFPQSLIYFTRFLTEAGPAVNILSGLSKVPFRTFLTFDILGESSYVLLYSMLGYYLGTEWQNNLGFLTRAGLIMVSFGAMFYIIQVLLYRKRRPQRRGEAS